MVIISFGADRTFKMENYFHDPNDNDKLKKRPNSENHTWTMQHGVGFLLQAIDEQGLGENGQLFKHSAEKTGNGISVAVVFRCVRNQELVSDNDNTIFMIDKQKESLNKTHKGQVKSTRELFDECVEHYNELMTKERRLQHQSRIIKAVLEWPKVGFNNVLYT